MRREPDGSRGSTEKGNCYTKEAMGGQGCDYYDLHENGVLTGGEKPIPRNEKTREKTAARWPNKKRKVKEVRTAV